MTSENHVESDVSGAVNDYDYDEIIRSGRELIDNVYARCSTNYVQPVNTVIVAQETEARPRNTGSLIRYLEDVDMNLRRIDTFVTSIGEDEDSDSIVDTSSEVVDLVNRGTTRRNRRRARRNVTDFVDLCTPPSYGRRESQSSDVEIIGVQTLTPIPTTRRRRKYPQNTNNNYEHERGNEAVPLPSEESSSKVTRFPDPSADNTASTNTDDSYHCPICLDLVKSRCPTTTKCGHIFCYECINTLLKVKTNLRKCPLCTKKIAPRDLVRLYF